MRRRPGTAPNFLVPPTTTTAYNPGTTRAVSAHRRFSSVREEINELYGRPVTAPLSPLDTTSFESYESTMTKGSQKSLLSKKSQKSSYRTRSADPRKAGRDRTTLPNSLAGLSDPMKNYNRYRPYDVKSKASSNHNFSGIRSVGSDSSEKFYAEQEQQSIDRSIARRGQGGELYSWLESTDEEQVRKYSEQQTMAAVSNTTFFSIHLFTEPILFLCHQGGVCLARSLRRVYVRHQF